MILPASRSQIENIADIWDKVSTGYDEKTYWKLPENKSNFEELLLHIGNPEGKRIIEIGCGSGFTSLALAKLGTHTALLDISQKSLDLALEAFAKQNLALPEAYLRDALNNQLPDNSFDFAWNGGVIEHFFDDGKKQLIQEMLRIVKPGGKVIILVPNSDCRTFRYSQQWLKFRKRWPYGFEDDMNPLRLTNLCKSIGITQTEVYAFNTILGWRWVPIAKKLVRLFKLETMEKHRRRSPRGFVSVLVITK
jgi:ubiquinone/menaquinone biosynthesis C-methylase UbiE